MSVKNFQGTHGAHGTSNNKAINRINDVKDTNFGVEVRRQFPIFNQEINGQRMAYLDSAATTQKPLCVIEAITRYYSEINANVHRGVHILGERASQAFEDARKTVQTFINAKEDKECIFVRGTTEAVNLVAHCFGERYIQEGDEILITEMEHHSNIVPWQMLCQRKGAHLRVIPLTREGELDLKDLNSFFNKRTKLLALTYVSNALGTLNPIETLIQQAHANNVVVFVDAAQAAPHLKIDVQALDCDFLAFSGHKVYGPTGIGVLYGKQALLNELQPYQGGGEMIRQVTFAETSYNDLPYKFEAGTPAIAEAIGLSAALTFMQEEIGFTALANHEQSLLSYAMEALSQIPEIELIGNPKQRVGLISFIMQGIHPHDIGTILSQQGVLVRTGHHCAMPTSDFFGIPASARLSFGMYNTEEDVDQCIQALNTVNRLFRRR